MNAEQIISVVVAILTGLSACIPLAYKLIQYVKKATQEKNWAALLGLVISLMEEAETKFTDGATRKELVMAMVQTKNFGSGTYSASSFLISAISKSVLQKNFVVLNSSDS